MNYEIPNDLKDTKTQSQIKPQYVVAIIAVLVIIWWIWPRGGSAGAAAAIRSGGLSVAEMASMLKG